MDIKNNFQKKYIDLEKQIQKCRLCSDVDYFNHDSVYFWKDNWLLFIWEAPAKNWWRVTWKAWINEKWNIIPSWKILQKLLDIIWINLSDVTFTEAVKCFPKDRKYLKTAIRNCNFLLKKQIDLLEPKILITLWDYPTKSLLWNYYKNFWEVAWKEFDIIINDKKYLLIPIYHPSPISPMSLKWNISIFEKIKLILWKN